jgi:hypothetical protein
VVRKADMTVARNYLTRKEIGELNRIVTMWLDFAEDQARRRKQLFLKDWETNSTASFGSMSGRCWAIKGA